MAATPPPLTLYEAQQRLTYSSWLTKAVIRRAHILSVEALNAYVERQFVFDAYIIKLLSAPPAIRDQVRAQLAEDLRALNDEDVVSLCPAGSIIQLLTGFECLPDDDARSLFIASYKTAGTVAAEGSHIAIEPYLAQPGHIPPINVP